jgi:hypothetical protein
LPARVVCPSPTAGWLDGPGGWVGEGTVGAQIIRNVRIRSGNTKIADKLSGGVEYKEMNISANGLAGKFKKGGFYTVDDGHTAWKVMFTSGTATELNFKVAEELKAVPK